MHKAVIVYTGESSPRMLAKGGTSDWVLDANRAARTDFAVCTRSSVDWREGHEAKGSAFLVAKVSGVVQTSIPGRYLIRFREYALVNIPNVWRRGWRNPVHYADLEEFDINPSQLDFKPMPAPNGADHEYAPHEPAGGEKPLTIQQAKAGLAITFGVAPSQIEITIRA